MAQSNGQDAAATGAKKPNILKRLWQKADIQPLFLLLAIKGALPATIGLAAYEAPKFAAVYTTLGYLVAIIAHLSLAIQPRAKFIQAILMSLLFTCLGAAMALLEMQCIVAARSTPPVNTSIGQSGSAQTSVYDASACAVAGLFLFFWIFCANVVKASRPQLMLPMIQFSIFVIVSSVYGPNFPNMTAAISFVRKLLFTFLTGQAIATGVSLLILPVTSRGTATKQMAGLVKLLKGCTTAQSSYMDSISDSKGNEAGEKEKQAAAKVKGLIINLGELLGKVKLELTFARKEIAYGKLGASHFSEIFEMFRLINQPVMGMSTFLTIIQSLREHRQAFAGVPEAEEAINAIRKLEVEEWREVISISKEPHQKYQMVLFQGLDHIAYQLELEKRPKQQKGGNTDVEKGESDNPRPGDAGFARYLEGELKKYQTHRNEVIQDWADGRNLDLSKHFWLTQADAAEKPNLLRQETSAMRKKLNHHQLYLVLYISFLSHSIGRAILSLAKYSDRLVEDGTMKRKRIINPGWRRIRKLFESAVSRGDADETFAAEVNGGSNIYVGDALKTRKDPEHLPPTNIYERVTDPIRKIPAMLRSEPAAFGFRAAVATMSLAIVAYLRETRAFFLTARGLWAVIMVAISMDPHSGQGLFGFAARIAGTAFAMVSSITIWYMCNKNHAAILVVFAIYLSGWVLFMIKKAQYAIIAMISAITVVLVIGYELQVEVIGIQIAESNGQPAYPVYILAPFRLATVCIGLGAAFVFTYFPYPITTHGALRRDLGSTLYILGNFYSCVHTTLEARLQLGPAIHDLPANHPISKLDAARSKAFSKVLLMLTQLRNHNSFTRFEPPFGGRFPREKYAELIDSTRNVFTYLALILYSSQAYIQRPDNDNEEADSEEERWLKDFREFAADTNVTSHDITTNLCLLSAAIKNGQPLPPYLRAPRAFDIGDKMQEVDPAILGIEHFAHPCYAAFAVGEVASAFVTAEMSKITRLIKELVGEVDFSFHVIKTTEDGSSTTSTLWEQDAAMLKNGNSDKRKGD